eukprot:COSAG06_NODE_4558_length_4146_cov_1.942426_5_plen_538_part_01
MPRAEEKVEASKSNEAEKAASLLDQSVEAGAFAPVPAPTPASAPAFGPVPAPASASTTVHTLAPASVHATTTSTAAEPASGPSSPASAFAFAKAAALTDSPTTCTSTPASLKQTGPSLTNGLAGEAQSCCCTITDALRLARGPLAIPIMWAMMGAVFAVVHLLWDRDKRPPPSLCFNHLDHNHTMYEKDEDGAEPYRACHLLLEAQGYTCVDDFCPNCSTAPGACNLECPYAIVDWDTNCKNWFPKHGNTSHTTKKDSFLARNCAQIAHCAKVDSVPAKGVLKCLFEPHWVEQATFIFFLGFTLPSLLFPGLIPLSRPVTAVTGAMLTVGIRHIGHDLLKAKVGPDYEEFQYADAVQLPTLMLLFSLMLISGFMNDIGTFEAVANLVRSRYGSPVRETFKNTLPSLLTCPLLLPLLIPHCRVSLVWLVLGCVTCLQLKTILNLSIVSALLSAILMNDTICLMLAPAVVSGISPEGASAKAKFPFLFALATSANIGGALTIVGNPQNNLISEFGSDGTKDSAMGFLKFLGYMLLPVGSS